MMGRIAEWFGKRATSPKSRWAGAARSSAGPAREANEDRVLLLHGKGTHGGIQLALVADGMGGHAAGEKASMLAVEAVQRLWLNSTDSQPPDFLRAAVLAANERVWDAGQDPDCSGMGTTLTIAFLEGNDLWIGHVGDSRAYRISSTDVVRLTVDDSYANFMVAAGYWDAHEAEGNPDRGALWQAIGTRPMLARVNLYGPVNMSVGEKLLLCTDGLYEVVSDNTIAEIVRSASVRESADRLIDAAFEAGSGDNISAVVLHLLDGDFAPVSAGSTAERVCV